MLKTKKTVMCKHKFKENFSIFVVNSLSAVMLAVVSLKVRETIFILKARCKVLYDEVCRQGERSMFHLLHVINQFWFTIF